MNTETAPFLPFATECALCCHYGPCEDDGEAYVCVDRAACEQRQRVATPDPTELPPALIERGWKLLRYPAGTTYPVVYSHERRHGTMLRGRLETTPVETFCAIAYHNSADQGCTERYATVRDVITAIYRIRRGKP